ncbi:hypothetical protein [Pseudoalteromonas luteoviolacea]|uniref:Orphan protein n=1 Tax=Pseudoalteromonas luteoviolacea S4054 TaxID=1129367 RepID=A0A0F6A937_9GAMM|nr:hypothetical protein [Pseudoalteromonas luteoviolacea]AOT07014.1 hypothetical protein S4054249_03610 [Pseudoalteromonas luteoviolacea]AOT11932.1 hypothetical protein S40542_03610 [Pseudoalteromonas luteoviolacea]AOT16844.1 hypothetical protein S4054_03610 [Pseudoalteromonas luteoviolacea]KKE82663.1 hypothetical protein N479_17790 [Pseudoalteromonas luteoviolacea S4054]KZN69903.1 hypothetical protein N481_21035 [Pseudoalteromonas luteoviolacea S4047-1]
MRFALPLLLLSLVACSNQQNSPELNQCAQQNFQCEQNCSMSSTEQTMTRQICSGECIERYNACKAQAEELTKMRSARY